MIDPKWKNDVNRFVKTGKASEEFMDALDSDVDLQREIELICFNDHENIPKLSHETKSIQDTYDGVVQDVRLAIACLEEAKTVSNSDMFDEAIKASRLALATFQLRR